ncbi:uncharacterized protein Dana_GF21740 [Drosophila ananassae]|uniref:Uncharacterized protein n=1 Tax=Drosophila ananassae TaxID=7217 RepID=B3N0D9_DROAN|nr:uncharacterized protein LOC6504412 [Drosophila ananassae]EDV38343.1 uncharacterized protein Dana_GF21740 [Drosophila ananassae]
MVNPNHKISPHLNGTPSNYIYLAANADYGRSLSKLCERSLLQKQRILLINSRQGSAELHNLEKYSTLQIVHMPDIESTPHGFLDFPDRDLDLVIFDLNSIVLNALHRPVMQQCSTDKLVRHIAKCSAAFANYREQLQARCKSVNTVLVMSQDSYPLTQAQFKLLCGLYFCGNECHTSLSKLAGRIFSSQ